MDWILGQAACRCSGRTRILRPRIPMIMTSIPVLLDAEASGLTRLGAALQAARSEVPRSRQAITPCQRL